MEGRMQRSTDLCSLLAIHIHPVCTHFAFYLFAQRHESSLCGLLPCSVFVLDIDSPCNIKAFSLMPCTHDQVYSENNVTKNHGDDSMRQRKALFFT